MKITPIMWIVLAAFAVRLALFVSSAAVCGSEAQFMAPDTIAYMTPAGEMIKNGSFTHKGEPVMDRTPGYPVFLIPGILAGDPIKVTVLLQILLCCLTVWIVYKSALAIWPEARRSAELCALLFALEPVSIFHSVMLLSDTLFTFILSLSVYCMIRYAAGKRAGFLYAAAVFIAACVYVRPVGYFMPGYLAVVMFIALSIGDRSARGRVAEAARFCGFLVLCFGLMGLWNLRNKSEADFSGFSITPASNLYYGFGSGILSETQGVLREEMIHEMQVNFMRMSSAGKWSNDQKYAFMKNEGKRIVSENFGIFMKIYSRGIVRMLFSTPVADYLLMYGMREVRAPVRDSDARFSISYSFMQLAGDAPGTVALKIFMVLLQVFYSCAALAAVFSKRNFANPLVWIVLGTVFYFIIFSGGNEAYYRFRLPFMPMICVLAGFGMNVIAERRRQVKQRAASSE